MGSWERPPPPSPTRQYRHRNTPSFSSSLLDAIYRSIDENSDSSGGIGEPKRRSHPAGGAPDPTPQVTRRKYSTTTSSSSSSSSYFSSDTDTPIRIRPIRTGPVLTRSNPVRSEPTPNFTKQAQNQNRNQNLTSIKKKLRELRRSAGPASPGAKLAGFLNSLFHPTAGGNPKKPKISKDPSPCSSASSYSRSCLSKTPSTRGSTGGKRSVRFCPVGVIVGEDCRPCGEKIVFSAAPGGVGGRGGLDFPARVRGRESVVEELLRGFEMEEDYESDSSEDLFELEIGIGKYRDELPVYETTSVGTNRAIARGRVV